MQYLRTQVLQLFQEIEADSDSNNEESDEQKIPSSYNQTNEDHEKIQKEAKTSEKQEKLRDAALKSWAKVRKGWRNLPKTPLVHI